MMRQNIEQFNPPLDERIDQLAKLSDLFSMFMKVERATRREGRPETDAEHTLHIMFLAVAYAARYHPELDPGEVALLVMIHDLDEVYAGDVNSLTADAEAMQEKAANEMRDRQRLREELRDEPYIVELLERYWAKDDPVVRYVYSIEKLDPSFSHLRDSGGAIRAMEVTDEQTYRRMDERAVSRMAQYATSDVLGMRQRLGNRVARATFDTV